MARSFDRRRRYTPGLAAENTEKKVRKPCEKSQDFHNRHYVMDKIFEYIKEGKSEEEALDLIMQDEIVKEFEYLTKNGLNLRTCFSNWVKSRKVQKGAEEELEK